MSFFKFSDYRESIRRASAILFVVFLFFYVLVPGLINNAPRLELLRNYFTIVSSYSTAIIACFGLLLGVFYYFDKNGVEQYNKDLEKRKYYGNAILDELNGYDDYLESIFAKNFNSPTELELLREKANNKFDNIELLAEESKKILILADTDTKEIMKLNSLISNSDELMSSNYSIIKAVDLSGIKDEYLTLLKEAKRTLYKKIVQ